MLLQCLMAMSIVVSYLAVNETVTTFCVNKYFIRN